MSTTTTTKRIAGIGRLTMTPRDGSSLTLTREASKRWHNAASADDVMGILAVARGAARTGSGSCGIFDADGAMLRNVEVSQ